MQGQSVGDSGGCYFESESSCRDNRLVPKSLASDLDFLRMSQADRDAYMALREHLGFHIAKPSITKKYDEFVHLTRSLCVMRGGNHTETYEPPTERSKPPTEGSTPTGGYELPTDGPNPGM